MPPTLQPILVELFRCQPTLALRLLHRLSVKLPLHDEIRVEQANPSETSDAGCRADLEVSLHSGKPALGIIVEAQLDPDTSKRYAWPLYASELRARLRCPVVLCVVTTKRSVARWAATPIRMGGGNVFQATVIGPASIPAIMERFGAEQLPELAVLSAIAHGAGQDHERAARIADAAIHGIAKLETSRACRYENVVLASLSHSARKLLEIMDSATPPLCALPSFGGKQPR